MPVAPRPVAPPLRVSHISEGNLIRKVLPVYPQLARSARIQGAVVLQAVISKEGVIENLRVVTGHPMLVPAAIDAVRQWRYRPYVLNNEPVEVETQITVNFGLGGS
jgi:protein TonB